MAGPFVAPVLLPQSSTFVQEYPRSLGYLKQRVARTVGGVNSAQILQLAEDGILSGIDDMNMRHYFRFGLMEETSQSLVAGTREYGIPADTFNIGDVQLYDSDGNPHRTLRYLDWGEFNRLVEKQDDTGEPLVFTTRNDFVDGNIQIYPEPDADAAADYTLKISAYKRIDRPTSDDGIIAAPLEIQDVLITYAEYYVLAIRHRDNGPLWGHKLRMYRDKLAAFKRSTERDPSQDMQFHIAWERNPPIDENDPLR